MKIISYHCPEGGQDMGDGPEDSRDVAVNEAIRLGLTLFCTYSLFSP